jgi:NagD protein
MSTGYLLDMDGVIYRENQLIPGAAELVAAFAEIGMPFLFVTNNSALTPNDLVVKLDHLGIGGLNPKHFYTSALNTADFLHETHSNCTVYTIGDAGLMAALNNRHLANDSIGADYVVVGEGQFAAERILKGHELIEKGARLVATNPDNWCPVSGVRHRHASRSWCAGGIPGSQHRLPRVLSGQAESLHVHQGAPTPRRQRRPGGDDR